jgi:hypothetical protein
MSDPYQLSLHASPAHMPLSFAVHPWFVINKGGVLSRWEVLHRENRCVTSWGHLHLDERAPFTGIDIFTFAPYVQWPSCVLGTVEGDEGSLAARMIACIEDSPNTYPFCHQYAYTGPNSNTYVQWALDQFPDSKLALPWNAFGKRFSH